MSKIKIKNFGPIKEGFTQDNGWLDIKKVTIFIGNQGSGKSVVAKLISTFSWVEKALTRGDYDTKYFERKNKLKNQYFSYHRIENYFPKNESTLIDYHGESFKIRIDKDNVTVEDAKNGDYPLPQIMYVPAERNFISNVRSPKALKQISPSLSEFVTEFYNAANAMKAPMLLPINNDVHVEYNRLNDVFYIKGRDYRINLNESSSGFQSLVPLLLVSWFLSDSVRHTNGNSKEIMTSEQRERFRSKFRQINENFDLSEELRRIALSELGKEFNKTAFLNIVEELEQNLFPSSQLGTLKKLLEFNNINAGNKLVITTHSPYIVSYLTLALKAGLIKNKIDKSTNREILENKLNNIFPLKSLIKFDDLVIYELDEVSGTIVRLNDYKGLPSDDNYLNKRMAESNELFANLLEIEDECQTSL